MFKIDHPNVIRIIEYEASLKYLALEYANANCLFGYLRAQSYSKNDEKWSRFYFKQVIEGIKAIHDQNIAHLDIKVDNVFLTVSLNEDDQPILKIKIGNFGMSKDNSLNV